MWPAFASTYTHLIHASLFVERDSVREMLSRKHYCFPLTTAGEVEGKIRRRGRVTRRKIKVNTSVLETTL